MRLYHSSQKKNLILLTPQRTISHDKYIGDYVFATYDKKLAVMYLATKGVAVLMNSKMSNIVICSDKKEYLNKDKGGAVYEIEDGHFVDTPQNGLSEYEKVSTKPVKPLKKTIYASSIKAFLTFGIKIYFVDQKTFNSLIFNPNQAEIIETLMPYKR